MKEKVWLECTKCGVKYAIAPLLYGCPTCRSNGEVSSLEVQYNYDAINGKQFMRSAREATPPSIWRWGDLLPPVGEHAVSLGEGNTPIAPLRNTSTSLGVRQAFVKHEASNPTGSFKDRLNAVAVSVGSLLGYKRATISSSGNQGVSLGTYAKVAGMHAIVFCPPYVEDKTLKELLHRGVEPVVLSEYGAPALALVNELVENHGWYVSSRNFPRPFANPFGVEGYKTIAFEIVEQLGYVPDKVFVPTGGGDSIYGVWKGFREMHRLGITESTPEMFACQVGGASLARTIEQGSDQAVKVPSLPSKALSIQHTQSGNHGVWAIRESGGDAYGVTEDQITEALIDLGRDGLCIEPSSAVSVAGAHIARARGRLQSEDTVVCIGTATGLRWSLTFDHLNEEVADVPRINPDLESLNKLVVAA